MHTDVADESLGELMEQLRTATRTVHDIDLDRAGIGDPEFIEEVDGAIETLRGVSEHGVLSKDPLVTLLQRHGFGARLDKVFSGKRGSPHRPIEGVHRRGLPEFDICLAPDFSPIDGLHGIFVTRRSVFCATLPFPMGDHDWRVVRNVPADDDQDMLEKIHRFMSAGRSGRLR